eukprot:TRINITY_DN16358_c0_g1_i1.p1 TRINITY_DN16358_c0_g1~~TRINITY_DN16358_c0_g1_i1.p1  ORF type:complete len:593 (-),score=96.77 TRINITY_DN16358_c0_g1_i1:21-1799(-)
MTYSWRICNGCPGQGYHTHHIAHHHGQQPGSTAEKPGRILTYHLCVSALTSSDDPFRVGISVSEKICIKLICILTEANFYARLGQSWPSQFSYVGIGTETWTNNNNYFDPVGEDETTQEPACQPECCDAKSPFKTVPEHLKVSINDILDVPHRQLLYGSVLLAFTRDGSHLLSYRLELHNNESDDNNDSSDDGSSVGDHHTPGAYYYLEWWLYTDAHTPVRLVGRVPLFVGQDIPSTHHPLRLAIIDTPDTAVWVVHGGPDVRAEKEYPHSRFLSIIPSPLAVSTWPTSLSSAHTSYIVQSTTATFVPLLSYLAPRYLLLNTGCDILVIEWMSSHKTYFNNTHNTTDTTTQNTVSTWSSSDSTPLVFTPSTAPLIPNNYTTHRTHDNDNNNTQHQHLSDIRGASLFAERQLTVHISRQECFEVETHLATITPEFRILDYDLQLVHVDPDSGTALLFVLTLCPSTLNSTSASKHKTNTHLQGFILSLNIHTGKATTLQALGTQELGVSPMELASPDRYFKARSIATANALIARWQSQRSGAHNTTHHRRVLVYKNDSVFSGVSVPYILHPFYPLALILCPPQQQQQQQQQQQS